MEINNMTKQMMDFQKTMFNNAFNTITMFQDQTDSFGRAMVDQNPVMPQEAKDAVKNWMEMSKKARDSYKQTLEESFKSMESSFSAKETDSAKTTDSAKETDTAKKTK